MRNSHPSIVIAHEARRKRGGVGSKCSNILTMTSRCLSPTLPSQTMQECAAATASEQMQTEETSTNSPVSSNTECSGRLKNHSGSARESDISKAYNSCGGVNNKNTFWKVGDLSSNIWNRKEKLCHIDFCPLFFFLLCCLLSRSGVFVLVLLSLLLSHFTFGPLREGWVVRGGGVSCRVGPRLCVYQTCGVFEGTHGDVFNARASRSTHKTQHTSPHAPQHTTHTHHHHQV